MRESKLNSKGQQKAFIDIDETISMLNWAPQDTPDRYLSYNNK